MSRRILSIGPVALLIFAGTAFGQQGMADLMRDADLRSRQKDFAGALVAYEQALKLADKDEQKALILYYRAHVYRSDKKYENARDELLKIQQLTGVSDARRGLTLVGLGDMYTMLKDPDKAREAYRAAVGIPGADFGVKFNALYSIGRSYNTAETAAKGREAYAEILQVPGVTPHHQCEAYYAMAQASFLMKNLPQAEADLTNSMKVAGINDNQKQRAMVGIAGIRRSEGKLDEAYKMYEEIRAMPKLTPNYEITIVSQMADIMVIKKQNDKAIELLTFLVNMPQASGEVRKKSQERIDRLSGKPATRPAATQPAAK